MHTLIAPRNEHLICSEAEKEVSALSVGEKTLINKPLRYCAFFQWCCDSHFVHS
jgi:hypothetical protein